MEPNCWIGVEEFKNTLGFVGAEEIAGIHHSGTIAEADTRALMYFVLEADKLGIQQHAPILIDCINEYNNDMDGRLDAVRAKKSREFMNEMADALRGK